MGPLKESLCQGTELDDEGGSDEKNGVIDQKGWNP